MEEQRNIDFLPFAKRWITRFHPVFHFNSHQNERWKKGKTVSKEMFSAKPDTSLVWFGSQTYVLILIWMVPIRWILLKCIAQIYYSSSNVFGLLLQQLLEQIKLHLAALHWTLGSWMMKPRILPVSAFSCTLNIVVRLNLSFCVVVSISGMVWKMSFDLSIVLIF